MQHLLLVLALRENAAQNRPGLIHITKMLMFIFLLHSRCAYLWNKPHANGVGQT